MTTVEEANDQDTQEVPTEQGNPPSTRVFYPCAHAVTCVVEECTFREDATRASQWGRHMRTRHGAYVLEMEDADRLGIATCQHCNSYYSASRGISAHESACPMGLESIELSSPMGLSSDPSIEPTSSPLVNNQPNSVERAIETSHQTNGPTADSEPSRVQGNGRRVHFVGRRNSNVLCPLILTGLHHNQVEGALEALGRWFPLPFLEAASPQWHNCAIALMLANQDLFTPDLLVDMVNGHTLPYIADVVQEQFLQALDETDSDAALVLDTMVATIELPRYRPLLRADGTWGRGGEGSEHASSRMPGRGRRGGPNGTATNSYTGNEGSGTRGDGGGRGAGEGGDGDDCEGGDGDRAGGEEGHGGRGGSSGGGGGGGGGGSGGSGGAAAVAEVAQHVGVGGGHAAVKRVAAAAQRGVVHVQGLAPATTA
jgi:hypothetical protein